MAKLCPFKKETRYLNWRGDWAPSAERVDMHREVFCSCDEERCIAYDSNLKTCLMLAHIRNTFKGDVTHV